MCEHDFDPLDDAEEYIDDIDPEDEEDYEEGIDPVAESWNEEF